MIIKEIETKYNIGEYVWSNVITKFKIEYINLNIDKNGVIEIRYSSEGCDFCEDELSRSKKKALDLYKALLMKAVYKVLVMKDIEAKIKFQKYKTERL